jgi:hypothetical protein
MLSPDEGTTKKSPTKPKLSRKILEDDHVLFYDGVHNPSGWLRPIQAHMSKMRTRIPPDLERGFKADLDRFECSGQDAEKALEERWSLSPPEGGEGYRPNKYFGKDRSLPKVKKELDDCQEVSKLAIQLRETRVLEPEWQQLLSSKLFKKYNEVYSNPEGHE